MSSPSFPPNPQHWLAPSGPAQPPNLGPGRRSPPAETLPASPILPGDLTEDYPNPSPEGLTPHEPAGAAPLGVPRLQQPPRGKRIMRKADAPPRL
jgi:hypothetical protein